MDKNIYLQLSISDPTSFYTQRWADGYMVYHCGLRTFSYSITRAKATLERLAIDTKELFLDEYCRNTRNFSYDKPHLTRWSFIENLKIFTDANQTRKIRFTYFYPIQDNPAKFAVSLPHYIFDSRESRLKYESRFDATIKEITLN